MPLDPESLYIHTFPDPVLRVKAAPVREVDGQIRAIAARMIELMIEAEGIGLAAPQVGLELRMFVAHVPPAEERDPHAEPPSASVEPAVFINPTLSDASGGLETYGEGCLSLPGIVGDVVRPAQVTVTALDVSGSEFSRRGAGLLARCWQHEYDHLDGVLILDRMTQMSRLKNRSAIRDLERQQVIL